VVHKSRIMDSACHWSGRGAFPMPGGPLAFLRIAHRHSQGDRRRC
jgi:hypothetical protein